MKNEFEFLQKDWNSAKKETKANPEKASKIIGEAMARKKASIYFHYGNIMVLGAIAILILIYFLWLYPFEALLSKLGIGCMLLGLLVRIGGELISVRKFIKINIADTVIDNTIEWQQFLEFRKRMHGIFTIATIGLYTAGFFMLYPEIYKYFGSNILILLTGFYIIGAALLIRGIRPNIKKEMKDLEMITELKKELELV